jgi:hypothetical protein
MKKILNSLPSTKPDHFFRSEGSDLGFSISRKVSYESQISSLLRSMTKVMETRLVFFRRDIEAIYKANEVLFKDLLSANSGQEVWEFLVP